MSVKNNNKEFNKIKDKSTRRYRECVEPRLEEIQAWARDGVPEKEMAKRLGIAYSTFRDYRDNNSALSLSLKKNREVYDNKVVEALHRNTLGETTTLTETEVREELVDGVMTVVLRITRTKQVYIKPDTLAQMYWLNNRQPDVWKKNPVDTTNDQNEAEALEKLCNAIKEVATK